MRNLILLLAFAGIIAACAPSDECVQARIAGGDIGTAIAACKPLNSVFIGATNN